MSQHFIDTISPKHAVMVGYDRPLDNFFATVFEGDMHGEVVQWCPAASEPEQMAAEIAEFAVVSPELIAVLKDEQAHRDTHPMHKVVDHRTRA